MDNFKFTLQASLDKPVKGEDTFFVDTEGNQNVTSLAMVIDGVTGMKKRLFPDGKEIVFDKIVSGPKTEARVWADLLKEEIAKLALDSKKELLQVVYNATKNSTERFIEVACSNFPKKIDPLQIPSATVLVSRIRNGVFETFSCGDCGICILYKDKTVEIYTGNKVLENIRSKRNAQILVDVPDFPKKSIAEQEKIRYSYMQKTKESLGREFFTPYLGGAANMKAFTKLTDVIQDEHKKQTIYANGMMWSLSIPVEKVQSIALFSDGMDPAFKDKEVAKELISSSNKKDAVETMEFLATSEAIKKTDQHAFTLQSINNGESQKQKVILDDRTLILLDIVLF